MRGSMVAEGSPCPASVRPWERHPRLAFPGLAGAGGWREARSREAPARAAAAGPQGSGFPLSDL
jgi:hypothetical protein